MMRIVFSYGGSILAPQDEDEDFVGEVAGLLSGLAGEHELAVVVGGGVPARKAIAKARKEGVSSPARLDWVGIRETRRNAGKLIKALGDAAQASIAESVMQAGESFGEGILVMGGTEPGHSTDAVAALLADWIEADLIVNASNIDYIYDRNPKEYDDAKPLESITAKKLVEMVAQMASGAGEYALIDLLAAKIIQRTGIKTIVLDGRDLENIRNAVEGKEFRGTVIE